jgi:hypothetical protein
MEYSEKENIDVEMKPVNSFKDSRRRAYWFMVSPYEKQLIIKHRDKQIDLSVTKKPVQLSDK